MERMVFVVVLKTPNDVLVYEHSDEGLVRAQRTMDMARERDRLDMLGDRPWVRRVLKEDDNGNH